MSQHDLFVLSSIPLTSLIHTLSRTSPLQGKLETSEREMAELENSFQSHKNGYEVLNDELAKAKAEFTAVERKDIRLQVIFSSYTFILTINKIRSMQPPMA